MEGIQDKVEINEVARNLHNFKLDHDYTPLTSPRRLENQEDDLVKTLSILDGPDPQMVSSVDLSEPPPLILTAPPKGKTKAKVNIIQSITITPPTKQLRRAAPPVLQPVVPQILPTEKVQSPQDEKEEPPSLEPMVPIIHRKDVSKVITTPMENVLDPLPKAVEVKPKAKIIKVEPILKTEKIKTKPVKENVEEESNEDFEDFQEDFDFELEDDENDSDYDFEKEIKSKQTPKRTTRRSRSEAKAASKLSRTKSRSLLKPKSKDGEEKDDSELEKELDKEDKCDGGKNENKDRSVNKKLLEVTEKTIEKSFAELNEDQKGETAESKVPDKKPKKKKEAPKPLPDDFALFSTPDIIRRVGGKEVTTPTTPGTPEVSTPTKPARITLESRAKSADQSPSPTKQNANNRSSFDASKIEKEKDKYANSHSEIKIKERRISSGELKTRLSTEERAKSKTDKQTSDGKRFDRHYSKVAETVENILNTDEIPSAEDIRSIILSEDTKSFTTSSLPMDQELNNSDPNNINLDATGLDIDPSLLANLNNDEISEDILYQVAKSLVSNPEIQNAIDKGINEGVLDPMAVDQNVVSNQTSSTQVCYPYFISANKVLPAKYCYFLCTYANCIPKKSTFVRIC